MKMKLLSFALAVGTQFTVLAQTTTPPPAATAPSNTYTAAQLEKLLPPALPEDVSSPEAITKALHESVSGPQGFWNPDRLRSLCLPNVFFEFFNQDANGTPNLSTISLDATINLFRQQHQASSWYESASNISVTMVESLDNNMPIANVSYTGAEGTAPNEEPTTNHFTATVTAMYLGNRWYIVAHSF